MRRLSWLLVLAALTACPRKTETQAQVPDAGPAQVNEAEPNDRPEQAQVLSQSTVVTASLTADPSHPDQDWYQLTGPALRTADVRVSGIPGVDVQLEVYDSDQNRVAVVNDQGEGKPERFPNLGVNGKVYVVVSSTRAGQGGAYTLTVLFSNPQPGYEVEPNDRAADSNELKLGEFLPDGWKVSGYVGRSGDEDWYRVDLQGQPTSAPPKPDGGQDAGLPQDAGVMPMPPTPGEFPPSAPAAAVDAGVMDAGVMDGGVKDGGVAALPPPEPKTALHIELSAVPGVALQVRVLSAAEAELFEAHGKDGEPLSLRNVGVRANDQMVYVVVGSTWSGVGRQAHRGFNQDQPYILSVAKESAGANAELEPNNTADQATPLPDNGYREGFLSPKTDVDYYVLRPRQPSIVNLQLSGVEHLDLMLSLISRDPQTGAEHVELVANEGAVKEPEYLNDIACFPECIFKVEGARRKVDGKWVRDYENAEQAYRLSVTSQPDNGTVEREPNNTQDTATPLSLGQPIRGAIQPKRDRDYYKLDLSGRAVKTPLQITATAILKVNIEVRLYRSNPGGGLELVQTESRPRSDAPRVIHFSADPGVYYVEVHDARDRESNFQDYYQLTAIESE